MGRLGMVGTRGVELLVELGWGEFVEQYVVYMVAVLYLVHDFFNDHPFLAS